MISTKQFAALPDRKTLQQICKAIAVLDAILSQDWEFRYYSYNSQWGQDEEFFEMRDGEGDQMLILFHREGCIINGFAHEFEQQDKQNLTNGLPKIYEEFIFGEPVSSIGTTFCLWTNEEGKWQVGEIEDYNDNSQELLGIFDGNPQTYIDWATAYFEGDCRADGIVRDTVQKIYNGESLTKEMVLTIVDELEDWEQLEADLVEIDYPHRFD
jgi:hypothetical protein